MISGTPISELDASSGASPPVEQLLAGGVPMVLRGAARQWGLVRAAGAGTDAAMQYLRDHDGGRLLQYSYGSADIAGRPFYEEGTQALNFEVRRGRLADVLDGIAAHLDDVHPPMFYLASLPIDDNLPGFRDANDLGLRSLGLPTRTSIWIGNRVTASCHYDAPSNLATCMVGRRRFTLFPPAQIANLYPGPLHLNPGGQAISMVDFQAPDIVRYPGFGKAMAHALSTVLEPGDVLYIPSMWWHHVEGLEPFNVLLNDWWNSVPPYIPAGMPALMHALWTIRDLPAHEKAAWREVFDYYVFGDATLAGAHLPAAARELLGPIDETRARQLRAMLMGGLNR